LFGHSERSFYANEIVRAARAGVGAVQRELEALAAAGLVTVSRLGNQKHYQANRGSPIFDELRSIVAKVLTAGPAAPVLQQPQAEYAVSARPARLRIPKKKNRGAVPQIRREEALPLRLGRARRDESGERCRSDARVRSGEQDFLWDYPAMQDDFSALFDHRKVAFASPDILRNPFRRKTILPDLKTLYEAR